ncbi:MAG: glycosyltransferase [Actinobacteria bacterium]|nr:glycosyltransferase [Actinomycetota bacterium]
MTVHPADYDRLISRLRERAANHVPTDDDVLVVSKGDDELLTVVPGQGGRHFPCRDDGHYSGFPPGDSVSAIAQLEAARSLGAQWLLVPGSSLWWRDYYEDFWGYLRCYYQVCVEDDDCALFDLRATGTQDDVAAALRTVLTEAQPGEDLAILTWGVDDPRQFDHLRRVPVFSPSVAKGPLPYADASIALVAVGSDDPGMVAEARRVASIAAVSLRHGRWVPHWTRQRSRTLQTESVSIIVPCYDGWQLTSACLRSVFETVPPTLAVEVVVVDDASSDETFEQLEAWASREPRLRVVRNVRNLGFIHTCNRGAEHATGRFLIFLNNDTVCTHGWLEPLVETLRDRPDAGAVGAKLVYPDGRLQEAGGVIFRDGSGANFGKHDQHPGFELYSYLREVDYCSGAALATPAALFRELGGFDRTFAPAYYEDTDYCFSVRKAGYRIFTQPASVVIHREGATSGTSPEHGVKRHQQVNRERFVDKWQTVLPECHANPGAFDRATWHRLARPTGQGRQVRRALVCVPTLPSADRESGSKRLHDMVDVLLAEGWDVTLVAKDRGPDDRRILDAMWRRGVAAYVEPRGELEQIVRDGAFDVAVLAFWFIGELWGSLIRECSPDTRVVIDTIDLHFLRESRRLFAGARRLESTVLDRTQAELMARELNVYASADAVLTVSDKEAQVVNDLVGDSGLAHTVHDNEDVGHAHVGLSSRRGLLFVGNFRHAPNVAAARFLLSEIVPLLPDGFLESHPLSVVGNALEETDLATLCDRANVHMVGWVPSVLPYLAANRMSVVPLTYGAGTKRKLVQSMIAGTPVISTSVGIEGLPVRDGAHLLVADEPADFAARVVDLAADDALWRRLSRNGRRRVLASHGRGGAREQLAAALDAISTRAPKRAHLFDATLRIYRSDLHRDYVHYEEQLNETRAAIETHVPPGAVVSVISKGDPRWLRLGPRTGWHFPRTETGVYAGHHPADSAEAIAHLEHQMRCGATHLVIPGVSLWWLEYYDEFYAYLGACSDRVLPIDTTCVIFELHASRPRVAASVENAHAVQ